MMMLQRIAFIFAILACCFRSCLCVNCERTPYHPSCRGIMTKRMYETLVYPGQHGEAYYECLNGNCKPKKYLLTILNDDMNRQNDYSFNDYEMPAMRKFEIDRKRRNDLLSELRNINRDYFD